MQGETLAESLRLSLDRGGRGLGLLQKLLHRFEIVELLADTLTGLAHLTHLALHQPLGHLAEALAESLAHLLCGLLGLRHLLKLLLLLLVQVGVVLYGLLKRLRVLRQLRVEPRLLQRSLELLLLLGELLQLVAMSCN